MKAGIATLGCKVNQYESQAMMEALSRAGFEPSAEGEAADVFIVNSCTVTGTSDKKVRQTVRKARRQNPDAVIILTGCMPQAFPEDCAAIDEADIVIGNSNRDRLVEYIRQFMSSHNRIVDIAPHSRKYGGEHSNGETSDRTRAYIKIEDGCNRFCSYCIIPYARGRVRSRSLDDIRREAELIAESRSEVVLVGINLSAYGSDIGTDLLEAVHTVASVDGIKRVRLSSMEPDLTDDELLEGLAGVEKFCPHFHLSIQSGCDETLDRMNRHYNTEDFRRIACKIREIFDNPSLTTDIMVGFAGETRREFEQSLEFCREMKFLRSHVFKYSRRRGTKAYDMENQVDEDEKKRRSEIMIAAMAETSEQCLRAQIGKSVEILVERETESGSFEGYTANYTPAIIHGENLHGKIIRAIAYDASGGSLLCKPY